MSLIRPRSEALGSLFVRSRSATSAVTNGNPARTLLKMKALDIGVLLQEDV